jgi:hypothetical protein
LQGLEPQYPAGFVEPKDLKKISEEDNNNSNKQSKLVTVIVKRIAKKDKIKEFSVVRHEWLR